MSSDDLTQPSAALSAASGDAPAPLASGRPRRRRRPGAPEWAGVLLGDRLACAGVVMMLVIVLAAVCAPLLTPYDPSAMAALPSLPPSLDHWFGTNHQGQDIFAQVVYGARFSLFIGVAAGAGMTILSIAIGMLAGFVGGWLDDALVMLMNIFLVIPQVPLLVVLAAYLPFRGTSSMILVLALTGWAWGARVLRSQTLSLRERDYVQAGVVSGEATMRLIFSEIMPNMISLIVSTFIFAFTGAILADTALEFLGFGDPNAISWGSTLYWAQNNGTLLTGEWWHFLFPGLAVALTTAACIFINYGIDAVSNPRLRPIRVRKRRWWRRGAAHTTEAAQ